MSNKEVFISVIDQLIGKTDMPTFCLDREEYETVMAYWEEFKSGKSTPEITEKGQAILDYMNENKEKYNNLFKAKEIGEGLFWSSRTVSGAMRKLVLNGYVEKKGTNPTVYALV